MGATVFANGMSIACKASSGKTIAAMPDVCLSPPSPPAGPIPIPYPNTAAASDTDKGSKTVQIGGEPVMLKDQSVFKTSTGNEAATKSFGMGVVTHQIQGEASFVAWSMDVKFEGENVPRHLDLMGHNEACNAPSGTPPWVFTDRTAMAKASKGCTDELKAVESPTCSQDQDGKVSCPQQGKLSREAYGIKIENDPCQRAARCMLTTKKPSHCCKPQTPHHLVPGAGFKGRSFNPGYSYNDAPCICAEGANGTSGTHGLLHKEQTKAINLKFAGKGTWKFNNAVSNASAAVKKIFPQCSEKCIKAQLRTEHKKMGVDGNSDIGIVRRDAHDISSFEKVFEAVQKKLANVAAGGASV